MHRAFSCWWPLFVIPVALWCNSPGLVLAQSAAVTQMIIPPGQEQLLGRLLGHGEGELGGCRVEGGAIERSRVRATFRCGARSVGIELHHVGAKVTALATTGAFAVVAAAGASVPAELSRALTQRLLRMEGAWRWAPVSSSVGDKQGERTTGTSPRSAAGALRGPPGYLVAFQRGVALARQGKHFDSYQIFAELFGQGVQQPGLVAFLSWSLGAMLPDPWRLADLRERADQQPDNAFAQVLAGLAAHHSAHFGQPAAEEKRALYAAALGYFERARTVVESEASLVLFQATSQARLGHHQAAADLIEAAAALEPQAPEVEYRRAEVWREKAPARARKALEAYAALEGAQRRADPDVRPRPERAARAPTMGAALQAASEGRGAVADLWDDASYRREPLVRAPLTEPGPGRGEGAAGLSRGVFVSILGGAAALAIFVALLLRSRRRQGEPPTA